MTVPPTAYPLAWPHGWPVTPQHKQGRSRFATTFEKAQRKLHDELRMLGASNVIVSSNVAVRRDGMLYADFARRKIEVPAVAVYFDLDKRPMVMARDAYWTPQENIMALAHTIAHMRGLTRHGGDSMLQRAFTGFVALPAPTAGQVKRPWWEVLGLSPGASLSDIQLAFREKSKTAHPDGGGSVEAMHELTRAKHEAMAG
jgi:hypothetical protein